MQSSGVGGEESRVRSAGMQECWRVEVKECRSAGVHQFKRAIGWDCRRAGLQYSKAELQEGRIAVQ